MYIYCLYVLNIISLLQILVCNFHGLHLLSLLGTVLYGYRTLKDPLSFRLVAVPKSTLAVVFGIMDAKLTMTTATRAERTERFRWRIN